MTREFGATSDLLPLDSERVLTTLAAHRVDYLLIGGLAALAHGSTMATADADVLPQLTDPNLERLLDALEALNAKLLVAPGRLDMEAGEIWEVTELRRGASGLRSADAWHFSTAAGPVDVVLNAAGVGTYADHGPPVVRQAFAIQVMVANLQDLLTSKRSLDRPKDREVIRELDPRDPDNVG